MASCSSPARPVRQNDDAVRLPAYINKPDKNSSPSRTGRQYQMSGINQVQVNAENSGMTFPAALRSILRQAPNII